MAIQAASSFLRTRLPGWLNTGLGGAIVAGLVIAGAQLIAQHISVGWEFVLLAVGAAVLPPAIFVGIRPEQRRARRRFVVSAIGSGCLVCVLVLAYGWPTGVLGVGIGVTGPLAGEE